MSKIFKKLMAVVLCLVVVAGFTACKMKSKVNVNAPQASITDEWTYDHAISNGNYVDRYLFEPDKHLPHFSCDGTNFTLNIVAEKVYTGTIEKVDDSNYLLWTSTGSVPVSVTIVGNSLTVNINENTCVVYVTK